MRTDMNTCTQPLTRVICLCMLCAVSESVELLSRAHPLNVVVLYIELSCMSVCASPLCLHMCCGHLHTPCVHTHYAYASWTHALCTVCTVSVHSCLLVSVYNVCIQGLCQTHCVGMVLTSMFVYCVWLVCLYFFAVYNACRMCALYSPCVCTVSVIMYSVCVHGLCVYTRHLGVSGLGTVMCICPPTHAHTYIYVIVYMCISVVGSV